MSWLAWVRVRPFKPSSRAFSSKADAVEWAEAHERALQSQKSSGVRVDVTQLTIRGLVTEYRADPETKSLRSYKGLSDLLAWWENEYASEKVRDWSVLKIREARERLMRGRAPATVNRHLSALRSCWNWGRSAGLVPQDRGWPARVMLTEPKGRTRFLSDAELEQLLGVADDATMRAAILISIGCGLRQSELLRLRWADVDVPRQRLRVMLSKNNESRSVYLPAAVAAAVQDLKRAAVIGQHVIADGEGQPVDKSWIEYRWKALRTAAGLQDFRWHDLRHTCASYLAQNGANLLEIGSVLGHKSPSVTQRYAHLIEGAPVTGHTKLDDKLRSERS